MDSLSSFLVVAGTVRSVDQAKQVADAGAKLVVSLGFNPRAVQWCIEHSLPIFSGVSSPTDGESAFEFALEVVKFFPAEQLGGIAMLKTLQGAARPLPPDEIHSNGRYPRQQASELS